MVAFKQHFNHELQIAPCIDEESVKIMNCHSEIRVKACGILAICFSFLTGCVISTTSQSHAETTATETASGAPGVSFATPPAQSRVSIGTLTEGYRVYFQDRELQLDEKGQFLIGFDRDAEPSQEILLVDEAGKEFPVTLALETRDDYEIQRIDGLPPGKVTPRSEDVQNQIVRERAQIAAVKERNTASEGEPRLDLIWPTIGPITGVYGSQRILNGKPRAWHRGIDVAAPVGTPIVSILPGVIALAEPDMYFTGGTIFVDHGRGLMSVYAHMNEVEVEEGQRVEKGEEIGKVGATGRVTGPHLHWGMYFFNEIIDPMPLLPTMPE